MTDQPITGNRILELRARAQQEGIAGIRIVHVDWAREPSIIESVTAAPLPAPAQADDSTPTQGPPDG
jgi:hypothetical protein